MTGENKGIMEWRLERRMNKVMKSDQQFNKEKEFFSAKNMKILGPGR